MDLQQPGLEERDDESRSQISALSAGVFCSAG